MIKFFYKKIIPVLLLIIFLITSSDYVMSESIEYSISNPKVFKRNKASCNRLGNVYDACHWMTRIVVKNTGERKISQLCLKMRVDKKGYELCYGKTKKLLIEKNGKKIFLVNLTELMNISIDAERPYIKMLSKF